MQLAATMAGWAFGNSMVGLVHAMAHSIGAVSRIPHGVSCGILLPYCMDFNIDDGDPEAIEIYATVAQALGVSTRNDEPKRAARAAVKEIFDLLKAYRASAEAVRIRCKGSRYPESGGFEHGRWRYCQQHPLCFG